MSQSAVRSVVRLVRSPVLTEEAAVFEFRLSRKFPDPRDGLEPLLHHPASGDHNWIVRGDCLPAAQVQLVLAVCLLFSLVRLPHARE